MGNTEQFTCTICNAASFDTDMKLKAHMHHCQKKLDKQSQTSQAGKEGSSFLKSDPTKADPNNSQPQEDSFDPRQERVPFGTKVQRFDDLPDKDKYHYRVFNDNWKKEPGRILRAKRAGYEVVDHIQSSSNVGTNEDGSEIKGVLMRIPKELHEEDVMMSEAERQEIDKQIHAGKYKKNVGDGRYIPGEGINISSSRNP